MMRLRQRRLELEQQLAYGVGLHPFIGQCQAGDAAAQLLYSPADIRAAAHSGVQAETDAVGAQRVLEVDTHVRSD